MKTVKDIELRAGFWLERCAIDRLMTAMQRRGLVGAMHIRCSDHSRIEIESLTELYDFPNASSRQITDIEITGTGEALHLNLTFSVEYPRDTLIRGSIRGDDRDVVALSRDLDEFLESVRPGYSRYFLFSPTVGNLLSWAILAAVICGLVGSDTAGLRLSTFLLGSEAQAAQFSRLTVGAAIVLTLVSVSYDQIRKLFFPVAVFAIGAGKARAERTARIRTLAFGTVLFGLTLSVAGNFLSSQLGF